LRLIFVFWYSPYCRAKVDPQAASGRCLLRSRIAPIALTGGRTWLAVALTLIQLQLSQQHAQLQPSAVYHGDSRRESRVQHHHQNGHRLFLGQKNLEVRKTQKWQFSVILRKSKQF
jgi:hypothetical protein